MNSTSQTHYLLIIHGTFASPKIGEESWYHPSESESNFCNLLAKKLKGTPLENSIWRSGKPWSWNGENHHDERIAGSLLLYNEILEIIELDSTACIHFIAHSHGGNVVLETLNTFLKQKKQEKNLSKHIGKIVFLGTPFYRRLWKKKLPYIDFSFHFLLLFLVNLIFLFPFFYIIAYPLQWFLLGLIEQDIMPLNPINWPLIVWAIYSGMIFIFTIWESKKTFRIDSNVYFDEYYFKNIGQKLDKPISSLVIHSGELDEAFLALSLRPSLDALLDKRIENMVRNFLNLGRVSTAESETKPRSGEYSMVGRNLKSIFSNILRICWHILAKPFSKILVKKIKIAFKEKVLNLYDSLAMGLPDTQLNDCRIEVKRSFNIPDFFDVKSIDVASQLLKEEKKMASLEKRKNRHAFLWDETVLNNLIKDSKLWHIVKDQLLMLKNINGKEDSAFHSAQKRKIIAIEQKSDEIMGKVSLDHCAYYESQSVINTISNFLLEE